MCRLEIDIHQPEFLPVEIAVLHELLNKHEQYEAQGRGYEARAMARAVTIMFKGLKGDFHDTQPTGWDSL
jgi:hypothetical protein